MTTVTTGVHPLAAVVKACIFDVFGTVCDFQTSVTRELEARASEFGIDGVDDWDSFTSSWRALYSPSMAEISRGDRPFAILDVLHRENLQKVLAQYGVEGLSDEQLDAMNLAWHRMDPWPDVPAALERLKRRYVIAPCSNANIAMMVDTAKYGGLPWDAILGAEIARAYKPRPEVYQASARALGLRHEQTLMVAAHHGDLQGAKAAGLATAFVARPMERGVGSGPDRPEDADPASVDLVARDYEDLVTQLGC